MSAILQLLAWCLLELMAWRLGEKWAKIPSKDYRDDPVYKKKNYREDPVYQKNLQRLIERSQKFEEESKSK
jgi:hypothetical protein